MKGEYKIPFDAAGNQLTYDDGLVARWKDNFNFVDTLVLEGMERGRSAANFTFYRQSTGTRVVVFMKDMLTMFRHARDGRVSGTFTFCKRGSNYGCQFVKGK